MLSVWIVFGLTTCLMAVLLYVGFFDDRSRGRPRCPKCWYNMTGAPSLICPECGHDARSPIRLYRTRRRRWAIVCAVVLAVWCGYLWLVHVRVCEFLEPVHFALQPTSYRLARLPSTTPPQLLALTIRIDRYGFRPWEERLLLWNLDAALTVASGSAPGSPTSAPPAPAAAKFWKHLDELLAMFAKTSDRTLDRLADSLKDPRFARLDGLIRICSEQAERLGDDRLCVVLDRAMEGGSEESTRRAERILQEMIRRNHPSFRECIARWADISPEAGEQPSSGPSQLPTQSSTRPRDNLSALAALRRLEGRPDPLRISITSISFDRGDSGRVSALELAFVNVDSGRQAFWLHCRRMPTDRPRWYLEVSDKDGRPMRMVDLHIEGRSDDLMLDPDENLKISLVPSGMMPGPGRYRARFLFHNSLPLGSIHDLPNLIVFSSDPFDLVIKPVAPPSWLSRPPPDSAQSLPAAPPYGGWDSLPPPFPYLGDGSGPALPPHLGPESNRFLWPHASLGSRPALPSFRVPTSRPGR